MTGAELTNSFKFTAREDDGTGLYYYRARYYHPVLGRFVSEDAMEYAGGDVNLYGFVGADPILYTDPLGFGSFYRWLYTGAVWGGDWNASDEAYAAGVDGAAGYLFERGAVRGAYLGVWGEKKLNNGFPGLYGFATAGTSWTIDEGGNVYGLVGLGLGSSRTDALSGKITRQRLAFGGGLTYNGECWEPTLGLVGGSMQGALRSRLGGSADIGLSVNGILALGIGRGPVSGGILIDVYRLGNIIPDNLEAIRDFFRLSQ